MSLSLIIRLFILGYSTSWVILVVSFFRRDLKKKRLDFMTAVGSTLFGTVGCFLLSHTATQTYDVAFLRVDASLGFNLFTFAHLIARSAFLSTILMLTYYSLSWVVGVVWVLEQDRVLLRAFVIAGMLCFVCYSIFPAVGPGHFDWVNQKPLPGAPDNCMPSMHFAWALLLMMNARLRWLRYSLTVYAVLIAASTIALEQHYVIDLIAALPYVLGVQWFANYSGLLIRRTLTIRTLAEELEKWAFADISTKQ